MNSDNVYPSVKELMDAQTLAILPASLAAEVRERYESLGDKYLTDQKNHDGRLINGMMFTSRIDNCIEEVVDAVFCILGWRFKCSEYGKEVPEEIGEILHNLNQAYVLLKLEQLSGTYS